MACQLRLPLVSLCRRGAKAMENLSAGNGEFVMQYLSWNRSQRLLVSICVVLGLGAVFAPVALASPKPLAKKFSKAKSIHIRTGPPIRPKSGRVTRAKWSTRYIHPTELQPVRPYFISTSRYRYGYRGLKYRGRVWARTGYTYYPGGRDYIAVTVSDSDVKDRRSATRYVQIQELTQLVHEWRSLNEDPVVHERVAKEQDDPQVRSTLATIRKTNERFDRLTRKIMLDLAKGKSVDSKLVSARSYLEKLIKLVETLPGNGLE